MKYILHIDGEFAWAVGPTYYELFKIASLDTIDNLYRELKDNDNHVLTPERCLEIMRETKGDRLARYIHLVDGKESSCRISFVTDSVKELRWLVTITNLFENENETLGITLSIFSNGQYVPLEFLNLLVPS